MDRWRLLIVAASAFAAIAVGLGAEAGVRAQDIDIASVLPFEAGL